jgi:hypothetical protein
MKRVVSVVAIAMFCLTSCGGDSVNQIDTVEADKKSSEQQVRAQDVNVPAAEVTVTTVADTPRPTSAPDPEIVELEVSNKNIRVVWDTPAKWSPLLDYFRITLCDSKPMCKKIDTWETKPTTRAFGIPINVPTGISVPIGTKIHVEVRAVYRQGAFARGTNSSISGAVKSERVDIPSPVTHKAKSSTSNRVTQPKLSFEGQQAAKTAQSYLSYKAFSKTGLIEQLEYEGFPKSVASAAVNSMVVDWNEQAYQSGKSYLDYSSFSKSGLISQLEFEGFTTAQARQAASRLF